MGEGGTVGDAASVPLPRWQSHKVVGAAEICASDPDAATVAIADGAGGEVVLHLPQLFLRGEKPQAGDFLVRYQPDGYVSWSPRAPFLAGYTRLPG